MKITVIFFALLLFFSHPASAENRIITPVALQGVWSSPDCTMADKVWIISKYFYIHTRPGEITVGPVRSWRQEEKGEDRYYHLDAGEKNNAVINLTNDGLMKTVGTGGIAAPEEYSHCAKLFDSRPALGQREVNSIFLLDHALENCSGVSPQEFSKAASCQKTLFDLVDSNMDDSLSRDELIQLHRQLEFLQAGGGLCPGAPVFYPSGSEKSTAFADEILLQTGGRAELKTLEYFFRNGQGKGTLLHSLGAFLPFLPLPDQEMLCSPGPGLENNLGASPERDAPQFPVPVAVRP